MIDDTSGPEFVEEDDAPPDQSQLQNYSQAVLYASDWTVETIVSQLDRGNIELNPDFQRRDAWNIKSKSRFIESIVLGLPIPQIVLAELTTRRGRYIVLDGKQRLLSLLQFTGKFKGRQNAFSLSGLDVRVDLTRKNYKHFNTRPELQDDLNAFMNHTIRTVIIRNWPGIGFLHHVFLRLNTGSLKLSPQELRQALIPGNFSKYVDKAASDSEGLKVLLSRSTPDPRMRDVELLVRFLAFRNYLSLYAGRMKEFLDDACVRLNDRWEEQKDLIEVQVSEFESGIKCLIEIFGSDGIARKPGSQSFNRATFDALIFYASQPGVAEMMLQHHQKVVDAYHEAMSNLEFLEAVESDTAGVPHTYKRLEIWGKNLSAAVETDLAVPILVQPTTNNPDRRIQFPS